MHSIELLEKRWERYRLKRRMPWYGYTLLVIMLFSYLHYRGEVGIYAKGLFLDYNDTVVALVDNQKNENVQNSDKPAIETNESVASVDKKPAMDIEFTEEKPKEHERKYLNIIVTDKVEANEQNASSVDAIKLVEKRFASKPAYEDALYLAKNYYLKGDYESSVKWSLASNNLNSNSEESWIIFAKSKAKLGKTRDAARILEAYLKENTSEKAQELLEKLNSGEKID